jgi:hypothetical protein
MDRIGPGVFLLMPATNYLNLVVIGSIPIAVHYSRYDSQSRVFRFESGPAAILTPNGWRTITWPWKPTLRVFPPAVRGTYAVVRRAPAHAAGCIAEALQKIALPTRTGTNDWPVRMTGIQ